MWLPLFTFLPFLLTLNAKVILTIAIPSFFPSSLFYIFVLFIRLYLMQNCFKLRYDELNLACIGRCSINEHLMTILFSFISSYFMSLKHVHGDVIQCQVISTIISNNLTISCIKCIVMLIWIYCKPCKFWHCIPNVNNSKSLLKYQITM